MENIAKVVYQQAPKDKVLLRTMRQFLWFIPVVSLFLAVSAGIAYDMGGGRWWLFPLSILVLPWLPDTWRWLRAATRYELSSGTIRVVRDWPFADIIIPTKSIISASRPKTRKIDTLYAPRPGYFTSRLKGIEVLTSQGKGFVSLSPSFGRYRAPSAGLKLYDSVTDAQSLVLIECQDRSYLISPEHPDEFVHDLRRQIDECQETKTEEPRP